MFAGMRVAVVGGGVIGAASAYHLARNGHEVVVLEAGRIGQGASKGNAGWICPSEVGPVAAPGMVLQGLKWMLRPDSPLYIKPQLSLPFVRFLLHMAAKSNATDYRAGLMANVSFFGDSMQWFDEYERDGVQFEMHKQGLLMAFISKEKYQHHVDDLDVANAVGLEPRQLEGDALREQEPALADRVPYGIYFPHERGLRSETLAPGLLARAQQLGVEVRENAAFEGIVQSGDRVSAVKIADGQVMCDAVVITAGVWAGRIAKTFGVNIPIQPGKGYSIEYASPPVQLQQPTSFADAKVVGSPLGDALRLAGTMEFSGFGTNINPLRVEAIRNAPARFINGWDPTAVSAAPWAGMRPMTPDSLSVIGRLGRFDNAFIAAGHGMLGMTMAPATAEAVVEMIATNREPERLKQFSPRRFR